MTTDMITEPSDDLTRLHYVGIILAVATDVIHPVLGAGVLVVSPADPLGAASVGAAGGFAVGIVDALRDDECRRPRMVLFGISFTAGQVIPYVALNQSNISGIGGIADRLVQLALLTVLFALYRRDV